MNRNRLMLLVAAVAAIAVAAGGFFLGVQPQLNRASTARADTSSIDATNETTRTEIARLREQAKTLPEMQTALAALQSSVPDTPSASTLIQQVNDTAVAAGVTVSTMTVGDPQAYSPPASTATGDAGSTTSESSSSATATPAPTAMPTMPSAPKTTTNSQITSQNFSVIPVSVSVDGDFAGAMAFVRGVQASPRLFLVNSISSATQSGSGATDSSDSDASEAPSWTFSGYVYVLTNSTTTATADTAATNG